MAALDTWGCFLIVIDNVTSQSSCRIFQFGYNHGMLPDLKLDEILRLRKPHPCGSFEWKVTRLGADIGLECSGCGHRILLTRRELLRRIKMSAPRNKEE